MTSNTKRTTNQSSEQSISAVIGEINRRAAGGQPTLIAGPKETLGHAFISPEQLNAKAKGAIGRSLPLFGTPTGIIVWYFSPGNKEGMPAEGFYASPWEIRDQLALALNIDRRVKWSRRAAKGSIPEHLLPEISGHVPPIYRCRISRLLLAPDSPIKPVKAAEPVAQEAVAEVVPAQQMWTTVRVGGLDRITDEALGSLHLTRDAAVDCLWNALPGKVKVEVEPHGTGFCARFSSKDGKMLGVVDIRPVVVLTQMDRPLITPEMEAAYLN